MSNDLHKSIVWVVREGPREEDELGKGWRNRPLDCNAAQNQKEEESSVTGHSQAQVLTAYAFTNKLLPAQPAWLSA